MNLQIETTITYHNLNESTARHQHHIGGSRSGKTYAILQWLIVQCLQQSVMVNIVRSTMPSLRRSVIKDLRDILNGLGLWEPERWGESNKTYTFSSGAVITFFSTDDEGKLRGIKADISWLEEASEIDADSAFQIGIRTTQKIIYSYNPTISPYHWLRQQYGDKGVDVFRTTYKDNPFIGKEQIQAIEDLKEKNPKYWQIYGLGEFAGNERQIFQFEIVNYIPDEADFVGYGMDWGYSRDETALVSIHKWGENIYLKELIYEKGLTTGDIISRLRRFAPNREEIWGDSSEPRLIDEIYRSGFNIKPVKKGPDSINFGIQTMLNYHIKIEKYSQNLINEMYGYQWAIDKGGNVLDKPEGGLDHCIDAARYVAMSKLTKREENKGKYTISIR